MKSVLEILLIVLALAVISTCECLQQYETHRHEEAIKAIERAKSEVRP